MLLFFVPMMSKCFKGQKISKRFFFLAEDSSKKRTKTRRILVKTNSFIRFLEEFMAWQFAFEINWPLACHHFILGTTEVSLENIQSSIKVQLILYSWIWNSITSIATTSTDVKPKAPHGCCIAKSKYLDVLVSNLHKFLAFRGY